MFVGSQISDDPPKAKPTVIGENDQIDEKHKQDHRQDDTRQPSSQEHEEKWFGVSSDQIDPNLPAEPGWTAVKTKSCCIVC